MQESRLPPINEIVGLLNRFSPETLDSLEANFPEHASKLKAGIVMGEAEVESDLRFRATLCLAGMKDAVRVCEETLPQVKVSLKRANTLQFVAQLLTVISGASIFGVLALDFQKGTRYAVAILALSGAIVSLVAQHLRGSFVPGDDDLVSVYSELVECRVSAMLIIPQLEAWIKSELKSSIGELITSGNVLSARIIKAVSKV